MLDLDHSAGSTAHEANNSGLARSDLQFLWLELTNRCNLQCVHCYAESGPVRGHDDLMSSSMYADVLAQGADLGCTQVQFIGGEPTLNDGLPDLIAAARSMRYQYVEVFTNLTHLRPPLVSCFTEHRVRVATSVYSHVPAVHDRITRKTGSFQRTMRSIDSILTAGLSLRASIVVMPFNEDHVEETVGFLQAKGVADIGVDRVRNFGRAADDTAASMQNLCGKCSGATACIAPDGTVSPCIMSKAWPLGCVFSTPLAQIVRSTRSRKLREQIYQHAVLPHVQGQSDCQPYCNPSCGPSCQPYCSPSCGPSCQPYCSPSCGPSCNPYSRP